MVQNQMQTSAGLTVLAMVPDTLSGRNPLYRLQHFFQDKDTELLLGQTVDDKNSPVTTWAVSWTVSMLQAPRTSSHSWRKTLN
jgi:hypothetical protein